MDRLYWLDRLQPQDRLFVGDKAFYLSQLLQRGYPVLSGFAIDSRALREFLETIHWLKPLFSDLSASSLHLDVDNSRQLQAIAQYLRQEITSAPTPEWIHEIESAAEQLQSPTLIFRPSIAINAGKHLQLNGLWEACVCGAQSQAIARTLQYTWAELFRARSLFYWQRYGIELHEINFAILVQPIHNARISGILQATADQFTIQATWGLGMSLVKGEVIPDYYQVQPETGIVQVQHLGQKYLAYHLVDSPDIPLECYSLSSELSGQNTLAATDLQQLIELAKRIRIEFGSYFSLEWTIFEGENANHLYLTQANPDVTKRLDASRVEKEISPTLISSKSANLLLRGVGASAGVAIAPATLLDNASSLSGVIARNTILVVEAIATEHLPLLKNAAGVISERGGLTSHGAIVARELGIPAVVSAVRATKTIQTGEFILVDGNTGEVNQALKAEPLEAEKQMSNTQQHNSPFSIPIATQLLVNLSQPSSIDLAKDLPVDGVGLLRAELMAPEVLENKHPGWWLQHGRGAEFVERWSQQLQKFAVAFAPRPVFYRALDLKSEGGIFDYQFNPDLFDLELMALARIRQSGNTNVHLLLPFVRMVEDFLVYRDRIQRQDLKDLQLWIMAEVPSILFLLPEYVKAGVQGISIGTNDLTQLLLGVDRESSIMQFQGCHPVVKRAISQLIKMAQDAGIPCSICGQAPVLYPELIDDLVRWGITSISVDVNAVETTLRAIDRAEKRLLLETARFEK